VTDIFFGRWLRKVLFGPGGTFVAFGCFGVCAPVSVFLGRDRNPTIRCAVVGPPLPVVGSYPKFPSYLLAGCMPEYRASNGLTRHVPVPRDLSVRGFCFRGERLWSRALFDR